MSRPKVLDEELKDRYWQIVSCIRSEGNFIYSDVLEQITGLTKGQIGKALQYGRRRFDRKEIGIKDYVMASPSGYFLPERGKEVIAYVVHNILDIRSRIKTTMPIYDYATQHWNEEPQELFNGRIDGDDQSDSMEPWAVFDVIMGRR